jgi:NAD(P)-dependent dehydrogenase (short-subunit alcohol dehydrogenase family)
MKINLGKNQYLSKNGLHPVVSSFKNTPANYFKGKGNSLQDKIALVTGGYKGIGLAIVKSFLREGAKVIFTGRNSEQMKAVYDNLDKNNAAYIEWDITDTVQCDSLMKKAFDIFGAVDILVNSAGIYERDWRKGFQEITGEDIVKMSRTNFIGTRSMCENYVKLIDGKKGKIINIISTTAIMVPSVPDWPYAISKWALLSYTQALGAALANNISTNGIAPGPVKTDMSWKPGHSIVETRSPNGRIGLPEEIAELALMLAGKTGDTFHGEVLRCDGGFVLK